MGGSGGGGGDFFGNVALGINRPVPERVQFSSVRIVGVDHCTAINYPAIYRSPSQPNFTFIQSKLVRIYLFIGQLDIFRYLLEQLAAGIQSSCCSKLIAIINTAALN